MTALVRAPLRGDLLGASDTVTVIAALHPLTPAREILQAPAGLSIAEIVALAQIRGRRSPLTGSVVVSIGVDPVPRERWGRVRPKAGTVVVLRARPAGGGGSLFKTIALLAVAILTAFAAPYLTALLGPIGGTLASAAITVGAGLLINALFPVNTKKDGGTVYSIAGSQNQAAPYQPIPMLHGRTRIYPRYGGSAYTEFEGDNQILRLLYVWGYGPMDVEDIKIGETPIEAFRDVEIQTYHGYVDDPQPTLYPSAVVQQDLNIEIKQVDGWTVRTTAEDATEWALDLVAPNGLGHTKKDGKTVVLTVLIEIQRCLAYTEAYQPVEVVSLSAKSTKPIRLTVRRPEPKGQYDIRWRRLTQDYDGDSAYNAATAASALRSYRSTAPITFRKPLAVTSLRIRATSQLSGIVDNLNGVCSGRGKVFDGTNWIENALSRNPGDQLVRAIQGPANAKPAPNARIDWLTIQEFQAHCALRGYEYNALHTERRSVREVAQDICSAGRGAVIFREGKWSVVWDDPTAPIVQHFTTRNSWGFTGTRSFRRLPHAYRVKFRNRDRAYRDDEIVVYADGYDRLTATLIEEVEFPGVDSHVLAWKHGRYHDAQLRRRLDDYGLNVDIEHLLATRGDRVRVSHDVPAWGGGSARVLGVSGTEVTIDDPVTMEAGKAYCVRFRLSDGSDVVRRVATVPGMVQALTLTTAGRSPEPGDLAMFGMLDLETVVLRVKAIKPGDDMTAEIHLVADAPEIDLADQGPVPDVEDAPVAVDPATRRPANLRVSEGRSDAAGGYAPTAIFLWDTPGGGPPIDHFEVALKTPGSTSFGASASVDAPLRAKTYAGLAAGSYGFRVRSLFVDGSYSDWSTLTQAIVGWSEMPPAVTGLRVDVYQGQALFSWDAPDQIVARTEIRYSPATTGATWETAANVVSRSDGTAVSRSYAAGTYLAKYVNGGGVYSEVATALVVTSASLPAYAAGEVFDFTPFGGSHVGTIEAYGGVRLATDAGGALVESGTYQPVEIVTLDGVYMCRISGEVLAHGLDLTAGPGGAPDIYGVDPSGWSATLQIRTTLDDPAGSAPTWSEWSDLNPGAIAARAYAVRVRLEALTPAISPVVELIHLRAEIDQRTETGTAVSIPAAGRRVDFAPAFQGAPAIAVTGRDFATGDRLVWGARDAAGFTLTIRDSAGTAVARAVDYIASGYGRRIA